MRITYFLALSFLLNPLGCRTSGAQDHNRLGTTSIKDNTPTSRPAASSQATLTEAERQRIEALIAGLRWSGTIGSGHGPPLQIQGNDSDQELVRIGAPAIPFLLKALEPVKEANPLAKRRNVAVVTVLGQIGDPSAVEGITKSMDQQWQDALFLQAATAALAKISDKRAIPALTEVGQLSLALFQATVSPDTQDADKPLSPRLKWWVASQHMSSVTMALLWSDAFSAIAAISPDKAMDMAKSMIRDGNEVEYLGAAFLSSAATRRNPEYAQDALSICQSAVSKARKPEIKELANGLLKELKQADETRRKQ